MKNMRYLFISLWLLNTFFSSIAFAQTSECDRTAIIITDPDPAKTYNPERVDLKNTFNWMQDYNHPWVIKNTPRYPLVGSQNQTIISPFYDNNNTVLSYLQKDANSDFYPADGWEIIHRDFGFNLSGSTTANLDIIPYVVLYNKFTGVLRVFGTWPDDKGAQDFIYVILKIEDGSINQVASASTANFNFFNNVNLALDQSAATNQVAGLAKSPNSQLKFFHADFPIAYDPCVCQLARNLKIDFLGVHTSQLKLIRDGGKLTQDNILDYVNGTGTYSSPIYLSGGKNLAVQSSSSAFSVEDGVRVYHGLTDYFSELKHITEENLTNQDEISNWESSLDLLKTLLEAGSSLYYEDNQEGIKASLEVMAKLTDFFINQSQDKDQSNKNMEAIARELATEMDGTITDYTLQPCIKMYLPGSNGSGSSSVQEKDYSLYNQPLGLFALLKTPKVLHRTYLSNYVNSGNKKFIAASDEAFILKNEDLQYVFNPAAKINLDKTQILASIELDCQQKVVASNTSILWRQYPKNLEVIFESDDHFNARYASPMQPLRCINNFGVKLHILSLSKSTAQQLALADGVPGDAFHFDNSDPAPTNEDYYPTFTPFLKLVISAESDYIGTDGKPNKIVYILRYPLQVEEDIYLDYGDDRFKSYDDEIQIHSTHFSQNTTIYANKKIEIDGTLTVDPGVTVQIICGGSITLLPGANVSPTIMIKHDAGPPGRCQSSDPAPQSHSAVMSFCGTSNYLAGTASSIAPPLIDDTRNKKANVSSEVVIYPNPNSGKYTLLFGSEKTDVTVTVRDITGQIVHSTHSEGKVKSIVFNHSDLTDGVYFVNIVSNEGETTKKIVVRRN